MESLFWKLIELVLILIFFEVVENNSYISLARLVRVKFHFTDSKKVM